MPVNFFEARFVPGVITQEQLARSLLKDKRIDGDFWAQRRFATPHLLEAPGDDSHMAFARALIATQHGLLAAGATGPRAMAGPASPQIASMNSPTGSLWATPLCLAT